jgi:preprotein translocase subunit SecG
MQETILIVYLVVAIALVGIILLQQGKGAEMGASFGAGGANTVFGAAGSGNALTKATTILAILFFGIALSISYINSAPEKVIDKIYDDLAPAESSNLESELPKTEPQTGGLESELPPTEEALEEASSAVDAAKAAESKAEEVKQAVEDEPKKDGNNQ